MRSGHLKVVVAVAIAALAASAGIAMAARPRPGVNLYGTTSWKGGNDPVSYVFLHVSSSGRAVTYINVPAACGLTPPRARQFAISSTGSFSGKRVLQDSGHGGDVTYTLKVSGRFTTPTKAAGTYSLTFTYESGTGRKQCHTGTQTWKANHVGASN